MAIVCRGPVPVGTLVREILEAGDATALEQVARELQLMKNREATVASWSVEAISKLAGRTADGCFFLRPSGAMTSTFDTGTRHPAPGTRHPAQASPGDLMGVRARRTGADGSG